jgi:integrase
MMRQAFRHAGFEGVTSHYFRRTVATLMDEAGLSARSAADQFGHAKPSLAADIYMGRRKRATGAAEVLEDLFQLGGLSVDSVGDQADRNEVEVESSRNI